MASRKLRQLNVHILQCQDLLPAKEGPPNNRNVYVQLELEDRTASTKVISGELNPYFDEQFSVLVASAAAPTLFIDVIHKEDDKELSLGMVKLNLGLFEDLPVKDLWCNLERRSFKIEAQGSIHLKIEFGSKTDLDPNEPTAFKRSNALKDKRGGLLEHYLKEMEKIRENEADLEKRVSVAEPALKTVEAKLQRREELISENPNMGKILDDMKRLEESRSKLQEMVKQMVKDIEDKDRAIRNKDKQIQSLELLQRQRPVLATPRLPPSQPVEESAAIEGFGAPLPSARGPKQEEDDAESVDEELEVPQPSQEEANQEGEKEESAEVQHWKARFEKEKEAKLYYKDRCVELEQASLQMLNAKLAEEEQKSSQKRMEELEELREKSAELGITVKLLESQLDEALKKYKKEAKERKRLYNEIQELKGNIRVYCRCRPISSKELDRGATDVTAFGEMDEITIYSENGPKIFEFDRCFDQESTQEKVFEDTQPLMQSVLDGFNVCIFAYGQTGSGKTFTMQGPKENPGVNTRALSELFRLVSEKGVDYDFNMTISIFEIYCEQIRDLLVKNSENLNIRQEKRGARTHNYIDGLSSRSVTSINDVETVIRLANENRSTASTNMNEYSSRSHLIMTVDVMTIDKLSTKRTTASLHMIDLAGSERVGRSGVQGQALKEAQAINQSLSALGNVLASLGRKDNHIPYRNSKLTHALADALGGNSKVLMFANISPSSDNVQETVSSLQFATRARAVELGKATANISSGDKADPPAEPVEEGEDEAPAPAPAPAEEKKTLATPSRPGARPASPSVGKSTPAKPAAAPARAAAPAKAAPAARPAAAARPAPAAAARRPGAK